MKVIHLFHAKNLIGKEKAKSENLCERRIHEEIEELLDYQKLQINQVHLI